MKNTFTQVILPIAALAGMVFFVTYVTNYTPPKPVPAGTNTILAKALKFVETIGQRSPNPDHKPELMHLQFWHDDFEVGQQGHFDFIFQNENERPVRLEFVKVNCRCASAELGIIPPTAWLEYVRGAAAAAAPGNSLPAAVNAFHAAECRLDSAIHWTTLEKDKDATIPPTSSSDSPQMGVIRLNWTAKEPEGTTPVSVEMFAQLPQATAERVELKAIFKVVPRFEVWSPSKSGRSVRLHDLRTGNTVTEDLVIWSRTQPSLAQVALSTNSLGDCISVSPPERVPDQELPQLAKEIGNSADPRGLQCAYRSKLTVREHIEENGKIVKRLDVGPLEFNITVIAGEAKEVIVPVTGMVRGEVSVIGGGIADQINFGAAFPSSARSFKQVTLESERPELDLELGKSSPDYLEVALEPNPPQNGKKSWLLKITIPPGKLFGSLSEGFVVLKTKEALVRQIRIPIKATSYFDGGSRP